MGPAKQPAGKKLGAEPGHPPHLKQLVPAERVNRTVTYLPSACGHCQERGPQDPPATRHQVAELPELAAEKQMRSEATRDHTGQERNTQYHALFLGDTGQPYLTISAAVTPPMPPGISPTSMPLNSAFS